MVLTTHYLNDRQRQNDANPMDIASLVTSENFPKEDIPLDLILTALDDAKSENLVTLPLDGKSAFVDYMVIVNGTSDRHIASIADNLARALKNNGYGHFKPEGGENGNWILMDLGNIIVHIFKPEMRELYALERMWSVKKTDNEKPIVIS